MSPVPAPTAQRSIEAPLLRAIGFWALAALVLNNTIGGGIFAMPRDLAHDLGAAAPWILVLGALLFVPIALCFSAAGSRIHASGGAYRYVEAALGPFAGFLIAAIFSVANVTSSGALSAELADQAARAIPALAQPLGRDAFIVCVYAVLCWLNARGVRMGARAIMALAALKLLPLALLAVLGLAFVHPAALHVGAMPAASTIAASMALVIFAYSGLETALLPSGEISDPSRVVPRATMAAIVLVVLLYVTLQVAAQALLGGALAASKTPLADAAGAIAPSLRNLLLLAAGVSLFGTIQNDLLCSPRLLYALASDGYLPAPLARVTASHVPLLAVLLYAGIGALLAIFGGSDGFTLLALFSGKAICWVYLAVCIAAWMLQRRDYRIDGKPFRLPGGALMPLLGGIAMIWVLTTTTGAEWAAMGAAMAVAGLAYAVARMSDGARKAKAPPD
ncbi:MAG: APC family permease [Proteobacteria bacterium]|nr:APC family permease [Pseudomonadota bacterium]